MRGFDKPAYPADEIFLAFTDALRAAGVRVSVDHAVTFLQAITLLNAGDAQEVFRCGRATLCSSPDEIELYARVFAEWFGGEWPARLAAAPTEVDPLNPPLPTGSGSDVDDETTLDLVRASASDIDLVRQRDVAKLTPAEKALLDVMIGLLQPKMPLRRAARRRSWRRGDVDVYRTLRSSLRRMGEPAALEHRRRRWVPRRVVLLVDVSASMERYSEAILRLAHRLTVDGACPRRQVETFTLGTRLTRVTDAMRTSDAKLALTKAGEHVPDWSGGTRLGQTLGAFLDRWGARGMARGAVVVVFSDGWERGDGVELGEQTARLSRLARRVVWVNPHRGKLGFAPVQRGMAAALPYCDDLVAGHSLEAFEEVLEVVGRA